MMTKNIDFGILREMANSNNVSFCGAKKKKRYSAGKEMY